MIQEIEKYPFEPLSMCAMRYHTLDLISAPRLAAKQNTVHRVIGSCSILESVEEIKVFLSTSGTSWLTSRLDSSLIHPILYRIIDSEFSITLRELRHILCSCLACSILQGALSRLSTAYLPTYFEAV